MTTFVSQMKGLLLSSIGSWLRNTTNASRIALRREMPHSITGPDGAGLRTALPLQRCRECSIAEKTVGAGLVRCPSRAVWRG